MDPAREAASQGVGLGAAGILGTTGAGGDLVAHILSVEDNPSAVAVLHLRLRGEGHTIDTALDGEVGLALARRNPYDVVVANLGLGGRMDGRTLLKELPKRASGLPVCVLQTHGGGPLEVGGAIEFAIDDFGDPRLLDETVNLAIAEACARVKAYAARSEARRDYTSPGGPHGVVDTRPSTGGSGTARLPQPDEERWGSGRHVEAGSLGYARWCPGPLAACRFLVQDGAGVASILGSNADEGASPAESRHRAIFLARGFLTRGEQGDLTWAAIERAALRERLALDALCAEPEIEALLALARRGNPDALLDAARPAAGATAASMVPPELSPDALRRSWGPWWWRLEDGILVAAAEPTRLELDRGMAPHSVTGPAIEYADGLQVYALHGRLVPAEWVLHPERITLEEIRRCSDVELRRALRELYGDVRYLTDTGARVVDVDTVPVDALAPGGRSLTRALFEDDEKHRFLVSSDGSTARVYFMRVPRSCKTCAEAYIALSRHPDVKTIIES